MKAIKTKISEGGRVVIPSEYRKQLGLEVGDEVMIQLVDGEMRIFTLEQALKRAQEIVRRYVPQGRLLSNELLEERRQENLRPYKLKRCSCALK
ncbi:AbrB/MazE/SpoVT family DNA-binding domain-containing protein [Brasilonema sp. UFV-L1]|uniref:AbrB/MazE/SpoVT family DNA-binding domain-containing protein n=1 Tax=Brasilonema sp. UFV-L1 TaxID=2234130 RepID=UPI00145CFBCE|nr:AbrB/MazE/SpoVT family DNA-binding domain-containing protein [Brasilonema sp. UFV-L1]NMG06188.1 AbrB/MazE/SpoVT family DNA-binding domain-containing protein [Brasilonema sp. UFV-L1]